MGLFNIFRFRRKEAKSYADHFDLNKKLVYSLSKSRIPSFKQLKYIVRFLTAKELWALRVSILVLVAATAWLGARYYGKFVKIEPARGGEYSEGLIGQPKYINPLYSSLNDVDNDLVHLVYSSLFKRDAQGNLTKDIVESYEESSDHKSYTFKLRPDVTWHDGNALTAEDVVFTFNAIKSEEYKSSLRQSFAGVEIEEIDNLSFRFKLSESYAAFLELLTFGIMPQSAWSQVVPANASLADLNIHPVGSGPYKVKSLIKDKAGAVRSYSLSANDEYYGGAPKIETLTFKFYGNAQEAVSALNQGEIEGIGYLPGNSKNEIKGLQQYNFFQLKMPHITSLFLNPKGNSALADKNVRQALALSIDRQSIINDSLSGSGQAIDGPILPGNFAYDKDLKKYEFAPDLAAAQLDQAGWKTSEITKEMIDKAQEDLQGSDESLKDKAQVLIDQGEGRWRQKDGVYLFISLTTVDREENDSVAAKIKDYWQSIGVRTEINQLLSSQIQSEVIKPRDFEALLYGQVVGNDPDPYPFWHSSQASSPGLNITNYSNKEVDQLLEDARITTEINVRVEKYKRFQEIISEDEPVIFLYSRLYTYVQSKKVNGFKIDTILMPYDRFDNIIDWFVKTKRSLASNGQ